MVDYRYAGSSYPWLEDLKNIKKTVCDAAVLEIKSIKVVQFMQILMPQLLCIICSITQKLPIATRWNWWMLDFWYSPIQCASVFLLWLHLIPDSGTELCVSQWTKMLVSWKWLIGFLNKHIVQLNSIFIQSVLFKRMKCVSDSRNKMPKTLAE